MRFKVFFLTAVWSALWPLGAAGPAFAGEPVSVTVKAVPEKARIGDEIRLLVQVEKPRKYLVDTPSAKLDLSPFEIKKVEDPYYQPDAGRVRQTFILTLTVFETGELEVPSFAVEYENDAGGRSRVMTPPVPVRVESLLKGRETPADLKPIKGPYSFSLEALRTAILSAAALVLAILLSVLVHLRKRRSAVDPESLKAPHERALLELGRLKAKGYLGARKVKEHYSEFGDILRRYLSRRYGIDALQETAAEAVAEIKARAVPELPQEKVRGILEQADLVKFAKLEPPRATAEALEKDLLDILQATVPAQGTQGAAAKGGRP